MNQRKWKTGPVSSICLADSTLSRDLIPSPSPTLPLFARISRIYVRRWSPPQQQIRPISPKHCAYCAPTSTLSKKRNAQLPRLSWKGPVPPLKQPHKNPPCPRMRASTYQGSRSPQDRDALALSPARCDVFGVKPPAPPRPHRRTKLKTVVRISWTKKFLTSRSCFSPVGRNLSTPDWPSSTRPTIVMTSLCHNATTISITQRQGKPDQWSNDRCPPSPNTSRVNFRGREFFVGRPRDGFRLPYEIRGGRRHHGNVQGSCLISTTLVFDRACISHAPCFATWSPLKRNHVLA